MAAAFMKASPYFRGIRPGLIEAAKSSGLIPRVDMYFRGIRPGLIEAYCDAVL